MTFAEFILAHDADDPARLLLSRGRYPGMDIPLAASTLECRRKLRTKVPEWYAVPSLVYPNRLSAEQCSSTETARYKAAVAVGSIPSGAQASGEGPLRIADLTGGLGVDAWAFSEVADEVLYNEMQTPLAEAAGHNFRELGAGRIRLSNWTLVATGCGDADGQAPGIGPAGTVTDVLGDFVPDLLFLDPARRSGDGRKVFFLEDCRPDVLRLLPDLLGACPRVLLKLSPMADISRVAGQLGQVREVHAVAAGGECKELLVLLERGWTGGYTLTAYENGATLSWTPGEEREAPVVYAGAEDLSSGCLFEPGKALLKAGAFRLLSGRFGLKKVDVNTHLYMAREIPESLSPLGKCFRVLDNLPLDKRTLREAGRRYPRAEVTARNVPMTSEELREKCGCASGGEFHLFALRTASSGKRLLITQCL